MTARSLFAALAVSACALALADAASAQDRAPHFTVQHSRYELRQNVATFLEILLPQAGRPTASVAIYSAPGYSASFAAEPGEWVGKGTIWAVPELDPLAEPRTFDGDVYAGDPALAADALRECAPGPHRAVWEIRFETFGLLIAVDPTQGSEQALGSYKLQLCSSELRVGGPGPPGPAKLLYARLELDDVFIAPAIPGEFVWRAFVVPSGAAPGPPSEAAASELHARVPIPYRLRIRARFEPKRRTALVEGTLTGGGRPLADVDIWVFRIRSPTEWSVRIPDRRSPTRTTSTGRFNARVRFPSTAWVVAIAYPRSKTCREPRAPTCLTETMSPLIGPEVRVRVPPRRR